MSHAGSGAPQPNGLDQRGLPAGYVFRAEWEVTPREFAALREGAPAPLLIDCRTEAERDICRIDGSLHVPLHELESRIPDLRDDLADDPRPVVVHCHHGVRSLRAVAILRAGGIEATSLAGGIDLWSLDLDPSVPRY